MFLYAGFMLFHIMRTFIINLYTETFLYKVVFELVTDVLLHTKYYKPHEHDQHSLEEFSKSLPKARKLNCNIWVAEDFNLPKMDWNHMCPSPDCKHPSFYRQIIEILNDSNLTPTVSLPTSDSNILDLFFTTNPTLVQRVSILPCISEHAIVQIQVNTSAKIPFQKPRSISIYKKANWDGMKQALEAYNQDMLESGKYSSLNAVQLWDDLHSTLTSLTNKFTPSKLSSTRNNLP